MTKSLLRPLIFGALSLLCIASSSLSAYESPSDTPIPTPKELWERFQKITGPLQYSITSERIIPSVTDPEKKLRCIDFIFSSQEVPYPQTAAGEIRWQMKKLWHAGVILIPDDPSIIHSPGRRGKVVIVGSLVGPYRQSFLSNYGDPIASRTGYPTMILPNPGELKDFPGQMYSQRMLIDYRKEHDDLTNHSHFRWAVPFLRALDIMADILHVDKGDIRAVIGGHSKRATSAYTAASIDPERIAGVVFMGNESLHPEGPESHWWAVSPYCVQKYVRCPILYIGATNESGYPMFNINKIQAHMKIPWTIEMIPNYWHASESEIQFLNWRMWVSHVFDGRPLTKISDLHHEEMEGRTRFQARIETPNQVILAHIWYVRSGDISKRRDLVWYATLLHRNEDDLYEGYVPGELPDIWFIEVQDTSQGFRGFVSSLPQDLRRKPAGGREGKEHLP